MLQSPIMVTMTGSPKFPSLAEGESRIEAGILWVRPRSPLDYESVWERFAAAKALGEEARELPTIWDLRGVDTRRITAEVLRTVGSQIGDLTVYRQPPAVAVLAGDAFTYALARQYERMGGELTDRRVRAVATERDALAWALHQTEPEDSI